MSSRAPKDKHVALADIAFRTKEAELFSKDRRVAAVCSLLATVARCALGAVIAYCMWKAGEALAGRHTEAVFKVLGELSADRWFAYIVGAGGATGYAIEKRKRRKLGESMGKHIRELEAKIDPNRSTSQPAGAK